MYGTVLYANHSLHELHVSYSLNVQCSQIITVYAFVKYFFNKYWTLNAFVVSLTNLVSDCDY